MKPSALIQLNDLKTVSEPSNLVLGPLTWQGRTTFSLSGDILRPGTLDDIPAYLYFTSHVGMKVPSCRLRHLRTQPVSYLITRTPRGKGNSRDLVFKPWINQTDELPLGFICLQVTLINST
jgi:hypothetical protein